MKQLSARGILKCHMMFLIIGGISLALPGRAIGNEWRATHGVDSQQLLKFISDASKAGMRPEFVQGFDAGDSAQFAAIAVKDGREWKLSHALDAKAFQQAFDRFTRQQYRLACVSGYRDGVRVCFTGIWVKDQRPLIAWRARHGIPAADYQDVFDESVKNNFMPVHVQGLTTPVGEVEFSALFQPVEVQPVQATSWIARHNLSATDYQEIFDLQKEMRPVSASAYPTKDGTRFTLVMIKDQTSFIARHGLSSDDYQKFFDTAVADDFRPTCISGYLEDGTLRYAAIFIKDRMPKTRPATNHPVSGRRIPQLSPLDRIMLSFMRDRSIPAGTLSVSRNGGIPFSRGYGWSDDARRHTLSPDASFRIASLTKPMTAACIYKLEQEGKLHRSDSAFGYLGKGILADSGVDARFRDITIQHLLEHQGGFDRDKSGDPMFNSLEVSKDLSVPPPARPDDIVRWMIGRPLDFTPGTQTHYSNFGYCVLGRIIEKVSGMKYVDYLREHVMLPLNAPTVRVASTLAEFREKDEPIYYDPGKAPSVFAADRTERVPLPYGGFCIESMDSHGGLLASAPDLVKFLNQYWIDGRPRGPNESKSHLFFGSLPGTHTCFVQRTDGVVWAVLFNQRADSSNLDYNVIQEQIDAALDEVDWP
ncbi:serine hydrolase [Schlesneria sp. T3-172]|uniref:serine hydrolase n=1 Tax=Schlesneria sphaerica TaxID=3373610 RepID=UPI0037C9987F